MPLISSNFCSIELLKDCKEPIIESNLELPEDISSQIKADKLFMESYNINPNFKFKYFNKRIIISLLVRRDEKHFLYYYVPLLNLIKSYLEIKD